jgi:multiple sugar transport system substrate-binding protein
MHSAILTSSAAPTAQYDVVLSDLIWTGEFAGKGYTIPLNTYVNKDIPNPQDIPQSIWGGFTVKGNIMAMPFLANFQNFYYNKKMLAEAGFTTGPRTMSEWLHQMQVLKAKHIVQYPYEDSWTQAEGLVCDYVRTAGEFGNGNLFNAQGQPVMNQGPALKALNWMHELYVDGLVNPNSLTADEPTAADAFASGQVAYNTNWTFVTGIMNTKSTSKIVGDGVVAPFPVSQGTNQSTGSASISGFQGLAIPANTPQDLRSWAWKWIQFATSPEIQAQHLQSQWPVWSTVANSPQEAKINPAYKVYETNLNAVYNRPTISNYLSVSSIIQQYTHEAIAGTVPVQQAADQMVKQIEALGQ